MTDKMSPEHYALEFFKTIIKIKRSLFNSISEQLPYKIGTIELMMIHYLSEKKAVKTSHLSDYLGIPSSTLTGILDRMETNGLILRTRDPEDRRVVLVSLSDQLRINGPDMKEALGNFLKNNNLDLPSEWWIQMTEELKKLDLLESSAGVKPLA